MFRLFINQTHLIKFTLICFRYYRTQSKTLCKDLILYHKLFRSNKTNKYSVDFNLAQYDRMTATTDCRRFKRRLCPRVVFVYTVLQLCVRRLAYTSSNRDDEGRLGPTLKYRGIIKATSVLFNLCVK